MEPEIRFRGKEHMHRLTPITNEDLPRHLWKDAGIDSHFAYFRCRKCQRYFYMRKVDLEAHLNGTSNRPLEERGSMFFQDKEGTWHMIFTIIS